MNKTTEALKLAEDALTGLTENDSVNAYFADKRNKALAAIREALAEPLKQEPVAWRCRYCNTDIPTEHASDCPIEICRLPNANAAPVDAKAIRAEALKESARFAYYVRKEALDEAAKWLEENGRNQLLVEDCAAAIRGLK